MPNSLLLLSGIGGFEFHMRSDLSVFDEADVSSDKFGKDL